MTTDFETWRGVPDWADLYEVSSEGRVRSLPRVVTQIGRGGSPYTRNYGGRVLVTLPNDKGYPAVKLCRDGKKLTVEVHSLVARTFFGECPEGCEVLHLDESRDNNRKDNLAYGTHAENMQKSRNAKLTSADVLEIRAIGRDRPDVWRSLANQFGVTHAAIRAVVIGLSWSTINE